MNAPVRRAIGTCLTTLLVAGCTVTFPHPEAASSAAATTGAASASPTATGGARAVPDLHGLPTTEATGVVIDTGIDATNTGTGGIGGFNSEAVAGGYLWLASPNGLAQIDPATNEVRMIDTLRGAIISTSANRLWRAAFFEDKVRGYEVPSGRGTAVLEIPGPYAVFATEDAVWVSEHNDGAVRKLDIETGKTLGRVLVSTPECCSASAFAQVGDRLFVAVNKDGAIVELDPVEVRVIQSVQVSGACDVFRHVADALWTCWWDPDGNEDNLFRSVTRIDPTTLQATEVVIGDHQGFPTEIDGEAWIAVGDSFVQLARGTGKPQRVVRIVDVDGFIGWNAVEAFGSVWIYARDDSRVIRVDAAAFH